MTGSMRIEIVDEEAPLHIVELLESASVDRQFLVEIVEAGVVSPRGQSVDEWQFARRDLRRLRKAQRLMEDLQVNAPGAALVLDLIEEREALLQRVRLLDEYFDR